MKPNLRGSSTDLRSSYTNPRSGCTDLRSSYNNKEDKNMIEDQTSINIVCENERDWINPETNMPYTDFNMCYINIITSKNMPKFKISVIVLDDKGDKLKKDIAYYFTEGRHYNIQMNLMCLKSAQIIITARMSCDTIYITTYNGADLFNNFNEIYKCKHKFHKIISDLKSNYYNISAGIASELRYGIIKYNMKKGTFIIIDRNRTMIYDSRAGFLDLKALSLKGKLSNEEINKVIAL